MNEDPRVLPEGSAEEVLRVTSEMKCIIEALIFASDEPMTARMLRGIFDQVNNDPDSREKIAVNAELIRMAVKELNAEYEREERPYRIIQIAGGFAFATQARFSTWVGRLIREKGRRKLSQTAIETLAIIAYKQPVTKSEIEFIRGVNADYIVGSLLEKNLITVVGRASSPGRPLLYGTTEDFLKHFGLNEISDLPKPREIQELIGETELEVEKRILSDQGTLDFKNPPEGEKPEVKSRAPHIPLRKPQPETEQGEKNPLKEQPTEDEPQKAAEVRVDPLPQESPPPESTHPVGDQEMEAADVEAASAEEMPGEESKKEIQGIHEMLPGENEPPEAPISEQNTAAGEVVSETAAVPFGEIAEVVELPQEAGHEKGWSKWKEKVRTFFRKLFG